MIGPIVVGSIVVAGLLVVEILRWVSRPAARRLRTIRKIGGRR
jgi:hypothetical protein